MDDRANGRTAVPRIRIGLMLLLPVVMHAWAAPGRGDDGSGEREWADAITSRIGLTQIYQQNVHGGLSTASRSGRYAGSYALEAKVDFEALLGADGLELYALVEGGWPESGGIDPAAVGSHFGVNADAIEGEWGDLSELWLEQTFSDGNLLARVGKLDLTGAFQCRGCDASFDGNKYANDETTQFLNGGLVNNPTIPFPDLTFGAAFFASPHAKWHLGAAVALGGDAETSWGSDSQGVFAIGEASFTPEPRPSGGKGRAHYRAGLWYRTDKRADSDEEQRGAYLSVSQPIRLVSKPSDDGSGLSIFARAGWADGPGAELDDFWSLGLQYEGLWDDEDVLGLGMGRGRFARGAEPEAPSGSETVWELYYNASITSRIAVGPSIQYVADPGGDTKGKDALAVALRLQMALE